MGERAVRRKKDSRIIDLHEAENERLGVIRGWQRLTSHLSNLFVFASFPQIDYFSLSFL